MPSLKTLKPTIPWPVATLFLLVLMIENAQAAPMERGVTSTGYETLLIDNETADAPHWCGNDAVVYIHATSQESVFTSGDLMHVNVVTGEVRTLRANIFKFYHEAYTDWPDEMDGDSVGEFFTWPLGCSPDGQWLFYRHEDYDGPISKDARLPELRAWNLFTGQQHVLSAPPVSRPNWIGPSGQRLLIGERDLQPDTGQSRVSLPWDLVEYPDGIIVGWLDDSSSAMLFRRQGANGGTWGLYSVTASDGGIQQLTLPPELRGLHPGSMGGARFTFARIRQNRAVGNLMEWGTGSDSRRQTFYSCAIEQPELRCQKSPPLAVARSFFVWSQDGGSVFYEPTPGSGGGYSGNRDIVRHEIATGNEETIVDDDPFNSRILVGDISPDGDRLLLGFGSLTVLFLRAHSR